MRKSLLFDGDEWVLMVYQTLLLLIPRPEADLEKEDYGRDASVTDKDL